MRRCQTAKLGTNEIGSFLLKTTGNAADVLIEKHDWIFMT